MCNTEFQTLIPMAPTHVDGESSLFKRTDLLAHEIHTDGSQRTFCIKQTFLDRTRMKEPILAVRTTLTDIYEEHNICYNDNEKIEALPKEGPRITGGRRRYQVNDNVKINCTSGLSRPHTQLMWFINGEQADPSYISGPIIIPTTTTGDDGETEVLFASQLGLFFRVQPQHFKNGDLKLKCLATISSVYWRSNEESVEAERSDRTKPPVLESREIPPPPPYSGSSYGDSPYSNEIGGSGSEAHSGAGRVDSVGHYRLAATRTEGAHHIGRIYSHDID